MADRFTVTSTTPGQVATHSGGTLAARPASPAAGDTYAVTTGAQTGARYTCFVTGSWEGTALPTASAAGELPVSDGAGSAYTATSAGDVLALGMVAALAGEPAGAALISDGAGDIATTSADVSAMLAAADAAAARTAIGAAAGATPDTITPTLTPGAWTSGQYTVLVTVTDSLGAPRIGTPVRLTHTSTGGAYSAPTLNLGTVLASQQNPANTAGFLLAATDYLGRVRARWNSPTGTTTTVTAVVLSEAPASLTLTPFVGP